MKNTKQPINMYIICPACKGDGEIKNSECSECEGTGQIKRPFTKRKFKKTLL